jgi:AraC family transcriptional regulator
LDLIDAGADKAVGRIASALARDRVHFSRAFGRALGFRPAEYRSVRRVSIALTMIKTSDESLVDIALSCGYAHQSHMNRAFKALYGRTPSSWRS